MSTCTHPSALAMRDRNGLAVLGPTLHQLRRIRFVEGEGGGEGGEGDGDGEGKLGDAGKKALDTMKGERNAARAEAKAFKDLGLTVDEIKALKAAAPKPEQVDEEKIRKQIRGEVERELTEKTAAGYRASNVREQAATLGFIDPKDALALLDKKELADVDVEIDDDGEVKVDEAAVKKLLEALAKSKPHLLGTNKKTVTDPRTAGIGAAGSSAKAEVAPGKGRLMAAYATKDK